MKIAISAGHNVINSGIFDNGTTFGSLKAAVIVKETVRLLIPKLQAKGYKVYDVTPYDQRFLGSKQAHEERAKRVKAINPDLYLDIHVNSGGGTGAETIVYSTNSAAYPYARSIVNSISAKTGLRNRGVKVRQNYWSVMLQPQPSIIVEGAFLDSEIDRKVFNAAVYAEGIDNAFKSLVSEPIKPDPIIPDPTPNTNNTLYKVQVGAYSVKANAEKMVKDLSEKGFKGYIIEEKQSDKEVIKPVAKQSEFLTMDGANIIKTKGDNISIEVIGKSLNATNRSGINGVLFDTQTAPVTSPNSCVFIAMNNGKPISDNASRNGWKAPARATIYMRKDGRLGAKQVKTINELPSDTVWAAGGYMVKPYMDFANEKIPSSVNYQTGHSYIGFDKDNNIYLISKLNHLIKDIVPTLTKLGLISCIVLDGGKSTQMKYNGKDIIKTSRAINTAILLKEV